MPFSCSICGEESTRICVRCTKDACDNHLCEKCRKCSDCCECEVALAPHPPESVREALHGSAVQTDGAGDAIPAAAEIEGRPAETAPVETEAPLVPEDAAAPPVFDTVEAIAEMPVPPEPPADSGVTDESESSNPEASSGPEPPSY